MERITYQDLPKGMIEKLRAIEDFIGASPLEFELLELMRLRAAQINGCAYCVDMHHKELKQAGETDLRLSSLCVWEEAPYFSEKERVVLKFTEQLTLLSEHPISDALFTDLEKFFDKKTISYLTLAIAQTNVWNRLMKAFQFRPGLYQVKTKVELKAS